MRPLAPAVIGLLLLTSCSRDEEHHALPPLDRPEFYTSETIDVRVVDGATGTSVAGAVVVANWRKIYKYTGRWGGLYTWFEGRTDTDGRLRVPRWGPRTLDHDYYLDARDPEIWILKRGYLLGYFDNVSMLDPKTLPRRGSVGKQPPYEVFSEAQHRFSRAATAGSTWNDRPLAIQRATSLDELAGSLEAANPIEQFEPAPPRLPLWWDEWSAALRQLPSEWEKRVSRPQHYGRTPAGDTN